MSPGSKSLADIIFFDYCIAVFSSVRNKRKRKRKKKEEKKKETSSRSRKQEFGRLRLGISDSSRFAEQTFVINRSSYRRDHQVRWRNEKWAVDGSESRMTHTVTLEDVKQPRSQLVTTISRRSSQPFSSSNEQNFSARCLRCFTNSSYVFVSLMFDSCVRSLELTSRKRTVPCVRRPHAKL